MHTTILTCVHHMELLPQLTLHVCTENKKSAIKHAWPNLCTLFTNAMQTLHYEEATLGHVSIHIPRSGTDATNLAQAHAESQTLILDNQAHLAAMQQQLPALTADYLQLRSAQS